MPVDAYPFVVFVVAEVSFDRLLASHQQDYRVRPVKPKNSSYSKVMIKRIPQTKRKQINLLLKARNASKELTTKRTCLVPVAPLLEADCVVGVFAMETVD